MKTNQFPSISDFLETTINNINKSYNAGMEASGGHYIKPEHSEPFVTKDGLKAVRDAVPPEKYFQIACSDARAAFWLELRRHYPEISKQFDTEVDGDDALTVAQFEIATEGAADAMLAINGIVVQDLDSVEGGAAENT